MHSKINVGYVALLLMAMTTTVYAECTTTCGKYSEYDGYCYFEKKGEVTIRGYAGSGGDLVLPDTIDGYPVTLIAKESFMGCDSITAVTIGDNVLTIGSQAFAEMPNMTSVVISDSVVVIKASAFSDSNSLRTVVVGSSVETILNRTFCPCTMLSTVQFLGDAPKWAPESVFCADTQTFVMYVPEGAVGYEDLPADGYNVVVGDPECLFDADCSAGDVCWRGLCTDPTLIELGSLDAIWEDDGVVITWITDTEIDNAYFNLYRAESIKTLKEKRIAKMEKSKNKKWKKGLKKGPYLKINSSPIPALGESPYGASYEFIDTDVQAGKRYWYKLEDVDLSGVAMQHGPCGPVSAWEDCSYMP